MATSVDGEVTATFSVLSRRAPPSARGHSQRNETVRRAERELESCGSMAPSRPRPALIEGHVVIHTGMMNEACRFLLSELKMRNPNRLTLVIYYRHGRPV